MWRLFFVTWTLTFVTSGRCVPSAHFSAVSLPRASDNHGIWYDGDDAIYILGGDAGADEERDEVWKYQIDADQISFQGRLPSQAYSNPIESDGDGNVFIFGTGYDINHNLVVKYNPEKNTSEVVVNSTIYDDFALFPVLKTDPESKDILLLGRVETGQFATIHSFSTINGNITKLGHLLPSMISGQTSTAVAFPEQAKAYVFYSLINFIAEIWEMDLNTFEAKKLEGENSVLPSLWNNPQGVSDGENIYIVTGFRNTSHPREGILQLDPTSQKMDFLPVENWPVKDGDDYYTTAPKSVYVPRLNRIYCFGGQTSYYKSDEIFWVNLS